MTVAEKLIIECLGDAIRGDKQSLVLRLNKLFQKTIKENPGFAEKLTPLLSNEFGLRKRESHFQAAPVDSDSRKNLLVEEYPALNHGEPIWAPATRAMIYQALEERRNAHKLVEHGLQPIKSILFHGDPGLGKTMSARWLAASLDLPLLTLDLATVMSSFLGKTGNNIKAIFDYAKEFPCVLLLDEFDAIAKKRDDDSEVGELKRLVTVLLQEVDNWPASSVLIAATNHEELLDPAAWRRFDQVVKFDYPHDHDIRNFLDALLVDEVVSDIILGSLKGESYSAIERIISDIKKQAILKDISFIEGFFASSNINLNKATKEEKKLYTKVLYAQGESQRAISEITGLARQTVKKVVEGKSKEIGNGK